MSGPLSAPYVLTHQFVYVLVQPDGTLATEEVFGSRSLARQLLDDPDFGFGSNVKIRRAKLVIYSS